MTPRQLGHRAAAWGEPRPTDITQLPAFDAAEAHRKAGLDPNGHPPRIPHLCERDDTKVCNCCTPCGTVCWAERFDGTTERLVAWVHGSAKGLLRKLRR